jgi:MFS family permease
MIKGLKRFNIYRALSLTWIFIPFQWDYLVSHHFSAKSIFLLNSIFTLAAVLFEIPTGVISDRIGRKKALILGGLSMSAGCGFFLIGGAVESFAYFSIANIFAALSMTLVSGCDSAYLYDLMASQNALGGYPKIEGRSTAWKLVGNVAGGVLGFLVARIAIEWTFAMTAVITLVASAVAALLPEPRIVSSANLQVHLSESFRIVRRSKVIISVLFYSLFLFPLLRVGIFLDPPHAALHGIRAEVLGLAFALKDLVSAMGSFNAGRIISRFGSGKVLLVLPVVAAVAFLAQGIMHGPWCYLLYLAPALALGLFSPVIRIMINQAVADSSRRATVLSVEGMFRRTGYAFFSPFIGWMLDIHTLSVVFVSMAFLGLAAAGISATIAMLGNGIAREARENAEKLSHEIPLGLDTVDSDPPMRLAVNADGPADSRESPVA